MKSYKSDLIVLKLTGKVTNFLDPLTSNSLDSSCNAFLDRFGKIVVVFYQVKVSDGFLIVVSKDFLNKLYEHLKKYLELSDVKINMESFGVFFNFGEKYEQSDNEFLINFKNYQLIITNKKLKNTLSEDEFSQHRLENFIPLQGIDFNNEMLLNVFSEGYVSYTKGCFLGQEVIARVHNLSKPPKKLVVVNGGFGFVSNN